MLVKEALFWGILQLEQSKLKELESRILLASALKLTQEELFIKYKEQISPEEENKFFEFIKRRKAMEPIAYILEKKEFYSRDFIINKHVLIPRPETEVIIDRVVLEYKKNFNNKKVRVLELGTGSGIIAITLARLIPQARIVATDISYKILELAIKNAMLNGVISQIHFIKSDWYSNLSKSHNSFDFIISNPPYIPLNDIWSVGEETMLYEPEYALFANESGLGNYKRIIWGLNKNFLNNPNKVFLEVAFNQAESVINILKDRYLFTQSVISKDLSGQERVVEFRILLN